MGVVYQQGVMAAEEGFSDRSELCFRPFGRWTGSVLPRGVNVYGSTSSDPNKKGKKKKRYSW